MGAREAFALGAQLILQGENLIFGCFADPEDDILHDDLDFTTTELMAITRRGRHFVEGGMFGYARLRDLPKLRKFQQEQQLLDVPRLAAIDRVLSVLPPDLPAESWEVIDEALMEMFSRKIPSIHTIVRKLRALIATIDASVNFDSEKRRKREESRAPAAHFFPADGGGETRSGISLITDNATMSCIHSHVNAVAREHKLGLADTLIKLLTGEVTSSVQPVLNLYAPKTGGAVHMPGFGWSTATDLEVLSKLFDATPPRVRDLDETQKVQTDGYRPTPAIAEYVRTRDGTCIYPGCHRPAANCQLDHRIPYGEGGETTPGNLFCLCAHHHNIKTDRMAFYIPDPLTGDVVWLFADGTWLVEENGGIFRDQITPVDPRWATTISNNHDSIARTRRFNALCHAICDEYEAGGDYGACLEKIRELECEYRLIFEFAPTAPAAV